jgi:hypothetical protein
MDRILRPRKQVLPDSALVDRAATHVVSDEQPYYLDKPGKSSEPDGTLRAGTKVSLVSKGRGEMCLIEDTEGRRVYTSFAGLRAIA